MKKMIPLHGWWGVAALIAPLVMPPALSAQDYLFTDAGRVKHAEHIQFNPISPITRGAADWNIFARAPKFYYPYEEWNSGRLTGVWWAGMLEEVLRPEQSLPSELQFYQLFSRGGIGGKNVEQFDLIYRRRAPIRLVGLTQIPLQEGTVSIVDPTIPSDQIAIGRGVWQDGQTWTWMHWALSNPDLDRSQVTHWSQDYDGRTTISGGSDSDSTIYLPEGQVLTFWLGHHWLTNTCRPTNFWGGSNHQNWGNNRVDYYGDFMESPSDLVSPALVPRAANLQIMYTKDSRDSRITDFDGSDLDDTGDPMVGAVLSSQTNETGEFLNDDIFGSAYFHFDREGNDATDRFSLTDITQNAPHNYFPTRNNGTVWGSGDWGGNTGRAEKYRSAGYTHSDLRLYYEGLGAVTTGKAWTGITESMVSGAPVAADPAKTSKNGEWQHLLCGPYILRPGDVHDQVFTMAVADFPNQEAQQLGQRYLKWLAQQKPDIHPNGVGLGDNIVPLTNFEKFMVLETIKDSLFQVVDQSFWAWHGQGGALGLSIDQKLAGEGLRDYPDGPPPPDIWVVEGPSRCEVYAWYPDGDMFDDPDTGVDDFAGWRVYRKAGRADVNMPEEIAAFGYLEWEFVADISNTGAKNPNGVTLPGASPLGADHYNGEVAFLDGTSRRALKFLDNNVSKGTDYFYAVAGYDDGSQNTTGLTPGRSVEGNFRQSASGMFGGGISVTPFNPGVSSSASAGVSGKSPVAGLGATDYALSTDAGFTLDIGDGPANINISASATADNVNIYDLVDDIQTAVDGVMGGNMVRVTPQRPVGKPARTADATEVLGFETVAKGLGKRLKIADLNDAALLQLGLAPAEKRNDVAVVPNPWSRDIGSGLFSGIDLNKILFDNLPRLCTLKIYTETGDLITSIDHVNQSSQEFWYQQTDSGQLVKPGIYILAVLEGKDVDPLTNEIIGKVPDSFVKFVIIR